MKIDLGCSRYKRSGYIGIDLVKEPGVDIIADARFLPFKDSSLDGIYSNHSIEHISDQLAVIRELWRVCSDGAVIHIIVPHFSNPSYYDDLTHQHKYSSRSFEHYDQELHALTGYTDYLPEVNLKTIYRRLNYWTERTIIRKSSLKAFIIRLITDVINYFANLNHFLCERVWCHWVGGFYEVEFKLLVKRPNLLECNNRHT